MTAAHATLAPAAAHVGAGQCTGSVAMTGRVPPGEPSPAQMEGDAAHWVASQIFAGRPIREDQAAPNGVIVTAEMIEAVEAYVDDVSQVLGNDSHRAHLEERLAAAPGLPDNWGTPDLWHFTPRGSGGLLLVWDFKYGHRFVDAFENWQLINYVKLILELPEFADMAHRSIDVVMTVVQPRNYHPSGVIRRWDETAAGLQPWFDQIDERGEIALSPDATTDVGPACRDCAARHICPALHAAAETAMDVAGGLVSLELDETALGSELRMLKRSAAVLDARIAGLEEQAMATLRDGKRVPFFYMEQAAGREVWTKPVDEVLVLGELFGKNLAKPVTPVTPNQARKLGIDATVISQYSDRPKGAFKLVPEDTRNARRIFGR
jgi:hypothetical protein